MKKQHFVILIVLICALFAAVHVYNSRRSVSEYSVIELSHEKAQESGKRNQRHYIQEGNPFDLGSENVNMKTTTTTTTTTTTMTTTMTNFKPSTKLFEDNMSSNLKTKNDAVGPKTDQIKKLETTLDKIKNLSLPVLKANLSKQLDFFRPKSTNPQTTKLSKQKSILSDVRIYNWNGSWSLSSICDGVKMEDFLEAKLNTMSGQTPIFVYPETKDKYVSHDIIHSGRWEHHLAVPMVSMLQTDPSLTFIDIGANIGAFTLEIAKLGRKTISVEPLVDNVQRLCCSVHKGKLGHLVTIVANAISNQHMQVTLGKDKDNVGGTFVNKNNPVKKAQIVMTGEYSNPVNTILLDDILGLPEKPQRVVIKMDVEGYEKFVLEGGTYFFQQVFVKAVFMEWTYSNNASIRDSIIKFMVDRDFLPYPLSMHDSILETPYNNWPGNIVWINQSKR